IFDGHDSGTIQAEYDIKSSEINVVENISQKILGELNNSDLNKNMLLAVLAKVSLTIVNSKDD
ncbi:hypothetical protein QIG73_27540, partial [Klebsiella pneumoniae]|nr:hypothetical protein [Klebsiella pneumoniae]